MQADPVQPVCPPPHSHPLPQPLRPGPPPRPSAGLHQAPEPSNPRRPRRPRGGLSARRDRRHPARARRLFPEPASAAAAAAAAAAGSLPYGPARGGASVGDVWTADRVALRRRPWQRPHRRRPLGGLTRENGGPGTGLRRRVREKDRAFGAWSGESGSPGHHCRGRPPLVRRRTAGCGAGVPVRRGEGVRRGQCGSGPLRARGS